jgi:hypothetical protein
MRILSCSPAAILSALLLFLGPAALAARPPSTSFCKCICFANSTIIALNPPQSFTTKPHQQLLKARSPYPEDQSNANPKPPAHHKLTCADCNRAFCLDYNLPICKDAREEDVFTTCFQRDSLKDEAIVFIFIFATAGLLGWAILKPLVDKLWNRQYGKLATGGATAVRGRGQQNYTPIGSEPRMNEREDRNGRRELDLTGES